jgi:hypothetical protein
MYDLHPNSHRSLPQPPPPPSLELKQKDKKIVKSLDERYLARKDCIVVKNIPDHYNVVNYLTKYFQR